MQPAEIRAALDEANERHRRRIDFIAPEAPNTYRIRRTADSRAILARERSNIRKNCPHDWVASTTISPPDRAMICRHCDEVRREEMLA